jgi:hypothetical protein
MKGNTNTIKFRDSIPGERYAMRNCIYGCECRVPTYEVLVPKPGINLRRDPTYSKHGARWNIGRNILTKDSSL